MRQYFKLNTTTNSRSFIILIKIYIYFILIGKEIKSLDLKLRKQHVNKKAKYDILKTIAPLCLPQTTTFIGHRHEKEVHTQPKLCAIIVGTNPHWRNFKCFEQNMSNIAGTNFVFTYNQYLYFKNLKLKVKLCQCLFIENFLQIIDEFPPK